MKTIKINGKIMEEKLKRGWTISRFAERFQVSEEEFLEVLQKNFSSKAYSNMVNRMKKNEKKFHASKDDYSSGEVSENSDVELEIVDSSNNENNSEEEIISTQSLEEKKEQLECILNEYELHHKYLVEGRTTIRKKVSKLEDKLVSIKSEIANCNKEIESLLIQYEEKHSEMQNLNLKISETKKNLEKVISEIKEKEKITIFVYLSGNIEFESDCKFEISDWTTIFDTILSNDIVEDLTIKQIKTLAQCLAYAKLFISQSVSYQIIFEDSNIEKCFVKLLD